MKIISEMELSGHMYFGWGGETSNSCGNCDGARCESCHEIFKVTHIQDNGVENEIICTMDEEQARAAGWSDQFCVEV